MKIKRISYDPAAGAFEARVDIVRNGKTFRYPCTVPGPVTMDVGAVRASVLHQASQMSGQTPTLYSHI